MGGGAQISYAHILHEMIENNDIIDLEQKIDKNIINVYDNNGDTPLCHAIKLQKINIINFVLSKIQIINIKHMNKINNDGKTPLYLAVKLQNIEIINLLINNKANINKQNNDGESPLYLAVELQNIEIIKLLLEKGANINKQNNDGESPLYLAITQNNIEIIKLLIDNKADINQKKIENILYDAIEKNNIKMLTLLLDNKIDINNITNEYLKNELPLTKAIKAINIPNINIVKLLIQYEADVNKKNIYGETPLYCAINTNNIEIVTLLIDNGADIASIGLAYLSIAINRENNDIIELLINRGANVNDNTPLHKAIILNLSNKYEIIKLLLEKGANSELKNYDNKTPLELYNNTTNKDDKIINILTIYKYVNLILSHINDIAELIKLFEKPECKESINTIEPLTGLAPIHQIIVNNKNKTDDEVIAIMKLLLKNGANINLYTKKGTIYGKDSDFKQQTPLHIAISINKETVVEWLLNNGADIKLKYNEEFPFDMTKNIQIKELIQHFALANSTQDWKTNKKYLKLNKKS